jgi:CBS domain-containing protein
MRDIPIDQVMTPDPAAVGPQTTVAEARRLLSSNVINHLPVVEDGRLVGIVSTSDFLKLHLLDGKLQIVADATVSQIMETKVIVVRDNATMRDAAEKLSVGGFHALPVVDRKRRLVGIVTSSDLVGQLVARLDA